MIKLLNSIETLGDLKKLYLNVEWNFNLTEIAGNRLLRFFKTVRLEDAVCSVSYKTRIFKKQIDQMKIEKYDFKVDSLILNQVKIL